MTLAGPAQTRSLVVPAAAALIFAVTLAYGLNGGAAGPSLGHIATVFVVVGAISALVGLRYPRLPLYAALAYTAGPLSLYVTFRYTTAASPYPLAGDLALDAAVTLGLLFGSAVAAATTALNDRSRQIGMFSWALLVLLAAWLLSAAVGVIRGNSLRYILTDLTPVVELAAAYWCVALLVRREHIRTLLLITGGALLITALIRLGFYVSSANGFAVTGQLLGGHHIRRLFIVQPYSWWLPLAAAACLNLPRGRLRSAVGASALISAVMVFVSFERGTWVVAALGLLPSAGVAVRRHPRRAGVAVAAVVIVLAGLELSGHGRYDPVSLAFKRLAYTRQQVFDPNQPLQNKRKDEANALIKDIRAHPNFWPAGAGLGATYVGPTGFRDRTYAASFKKKHYAFDLYLGVALRSGLIGLAALGALLAAMVFLPLSRIRATADHRHRLLCTSVIALTLGLAGISIVNPGLLLHPLVLYQGLTFALLLATPLPEPRRPHAG
jgi:hypothetical protein